MTYKEGDRVQGKYSHKGKVGTILTGGGETFACIKWDGGKRKSWLEVANLEIYVEAECDA